MDQTASDRSCAFAALASERRSPRDVVLSEGPKQSPFRSISSPRTRKAMARNVANVLVEALTARGGA